MPKTRLRRRAKQGYYCNIGGCGGFATRADASAPSPFPARAAPILPWRARRVSARFLFGALYEARARSRVAILQHAVARIQQIWRGYCSTNFDDLTLHRKHTAHPSQCAAMICIDRSPAATYRNNHDPLSMMLGNLPSGAQQQDNKGCAPCANASGLQRLHGNRTAIRADIHIALRPSEASDLRSFACCQ